MCAHDLYTSRLFFLLVGNDYYIEPSSRGSQSHAKVPRSHAHPYIPLPAYLAGRRFTMRDIHTRVGRAGRHEFWAHAAHEARDMLRKSRRHEQTRNVSARGAYQSTDWLPKMVYIRGCLLLFPSQVVCVLMCCVPHPLTHRPAALAWKTTNLPLKR